MCAINLYDFFCSVKLFVLSVSLIHSIFTLMVPRQKETKTRPNVANKSACSNHRIHLKESFDYFPQWRKLRLFFSMRWHQIQWRAVLKSSCSAFFKTLYTYFPWKKTSVARSSGKHFAYDCYSEISLSVVTSKHFQGACLPHLLGSETWPCCPSPLCMNQDLRG